jgi:TRAP-type C4-dicarboxylate transport system permease small subunit
MEKIGRTITWIDDLILKITLAICGGILTVMVVVAALGVFCRFILHASLSWSEELDSYLFVWLTCLGAAAGIKLRAHPEVRAGVDRLPSYTQKWLAYLGDCIVLALGVVFLYYGSEMVLLMDVETAASIPVSMVYPYLSIPVGGALLIWHSSVRILVSYLVSGVTQDTAAAALAISKHI